MKLARTLRLVRHLRPRQILGQVTYALRFRVRPVRLGGEPPTWAIPRAAVAFLPPPVHTAWDGEGRFELVGGAVDFGDLAAIDWQHEGAGSLWAYQLHFFEWVRDPGVSPAARARVVTSWLDHADDAGAPASPGWDPHPLSVRTLSWTKLCLEPGLLAADARLDARMRASLADQVETLSRHLEYRLQANHLLDNLIAVTAGALALDGARSQRWRSYLRLLERELEDQIDADGAHCERCPMYHAVVLEHLLDLLNIARAAGRSAPAGLDAKLAEVCSRMLGAQRVWTHPDGRIALFGDSAFGIAAEPAALECYAASLGVEPTVPRMVRALRSAGFARLESQELSLIASLAGPSPPHQPGHAHCDALAFELSAGAQRIVTDTGVCEYAIGERRTICRSTRAHATAMVDAEEQAEIWAAHRIGGRPRVEITQLEDGRVVAGTCRGWSTPDTLHRRSFRGSANGLEIVDQIEGSRRPVLFSLPLAPGIEPDPRAVAEGCVRIPLADDRTLELSLPDSLAWRIERGAYYPAFGCALERAVLVGEAERFESGTTRFRILA